MILKTMKKPMVVEAVQFTGEPHNMIVLADWSNGQVWRKDQETLYVKCLEALAETPIGSYVVKGIKGEVWPVREDIFLETYEIVKD